MGSQRVGHDWATELSEWREMQLLRSKILFIVLTHLSASAELLAINLEFLYPLKYLDDTTLMAENEEKLKSLLMKVKEESKKAGLQLNI